MQWTEFASVGGRIEVRDSHDNASLIVHIQNGSDQLGAARLDGYEMKTHEMSFSGSKISSTACYVDIHSITSGNL